MGRKAAFLIRLVLTLCISCIMGVLTVLPYYRLPPEHFPADGMFCYWAALFLLPVLSLLLMGIRLGLAGVLRPPSDSL